MKIFLMTLLMTLLLVACSNNSSTPGSSTAVASANFTSIDRCKQLGGTWSRDGTIFFFGCLRPAIDAGKACTDSSQCEFHCNARKGEKPAPGQRTVGQCQATNSYRGCNIEIANGFARKEFCTKI